MSDSNLETPCLNTALSKTGAGYGQVRMNGKQYLAHRLAYELAYGRLLPGEVVRHLCGNRACVNPLHLSVGSHKDNAEDRLRHGNTARGEIHGNSRLTEEQVRQMRSMREGGAKLRELSSRFGVSESSASMICRRKHWEHVV